MGKKGKKSKDKAKPKDTNGLTEVDKTFYELTIADLNRKIERLRDLTHDLERRNQELKAQLETTVEDNNDIISYLKKVMTIKNDEIAELREGLQGLEETRVRETKEFLQQIADKEVEYQKMHESLQSEIQLLEGKLNALEDFRVQKEELMKKFEDQQKAIEEQEARHKQELYEIERKFIVGKSILMKQMEHRLQTLSVEFQNASETRIAATTHRLIRENVAINNELDTMLETHRRLIEENAKFKGNNKINKNKIELLEEQRNQVLKKFKIQRRIIEEITEKHQHLVGVLNQNRINQDEMEIAKKRLEEALNMRYLTEKELDLLKQDLHAIRCENNSLRNELKNVKDDYAKARLTMNRVAMAIKDALSLEVVSDESLKVTKRNDLMNYLLELLTEEPVLYEQPAETTSVKAMTTYDKGDLGFVQKPESVPKLLSSLKKNVPAPKRPRSIKLVVETEKEEKIGSQQTIGKGMGKEKRHEKEEASRQSGKYTFKQEEKENGQAEALTSSSKFSLAELHLSLGEKKGSAPSEEVSVVLDTKKDDEEKSEKDKDE